MKNPAVHGMGEKRPKQHGIPTGIKQKSAVQCAGVGMDAVSEAAMVKIFVFSWSYRLALFLGPSCAVREIKCRQSLEMSGLA